MYSKFTQHRRAGFKSMALPLIVLVLGITASYSSLAQAKYFVSNGKSIAISKFNDDVEKVIDDACVPAVSLAIIENGRIVFSNAYGYKRLSTKEKVDKETIFEAASLSKSFLAYVAFKLVDEGKLKLDKPIYQYMEYEALQHDPRYKLITPRMILSHSSGIENWRSMNNPDTLEILNDPGTKFVYSGEGYNYLAKVIELILNESYEQYTKQMLISPMKLKRSFVKYEENSSTHTSFPTNYAIGHDAFGREYEKWKNHEPVPSSANNMTAEDYAKLMLAIFDKKHLSGKSIKTILTPVVKTGPDPFSSSYGTGFEIYYSHNDTIIGHGGDNIGFEAQVMYSVTHKRGFVFLTNGERGKLLTVKLNEMTAGLDIRRHYAENYPFPFPSFAAHLFKTYRDKGPQAMLTELENPEHAKDINENTLFTLAWDLTDKENEIARKLFWRSAALYPASSSTFGFMGELNMKLGEYDTAYKNYTKAKELHFKWWDVDSKLKECEAHINDAKARSILLVTIPEKGESVIHAERYNVMNRIQTGPAAESEGGVTVGYMTLGTWMDYKVKIERAGTYSFLLRVASPNDDSKVQLQIGSTILAAVDVHSTTGWQKWTTLSVNVELPAGEQVLRLYESAGESGFNINWVKFVPVQTN